MEQMTLGQIGSVLVWLAGIISASGVISAFVTKKMKGLFKDEMAGTNNRIDSLNNRINDLDVDNTKNFLVEFLAKFDCVGDSCPVITDEELQRFYEVYDHYTKPKEDGGLGLNTYIHEKVERLKKQGKL